MDKCADVVKFKDVTVRFADNVALSNVNLSIKRGEFVALMGANGSGKTTLLRTIIGLCKPANGDIFVFCKKISQKNISNILRKIGFVFQNPDDQLFALTVIEDISYGPQNLGLDDGENSIRCKQALDIVEMDEFRHSRIYDLSFGQKRRVALAGVLAMNPDVILLDEPTSGLDPKGATKIMKLLKRLNKNSGTTIIAATHDCDMVPLHASRVIILNKGKVVGDGSSRDIFSDFEIIRNAKLRLPRVSHLAEVLSKDHREFFNDIPLTIGQARRRFSEVINEKIAK